MAFWASPLTSRLATTTGRIEFVILRTDCSLPVALHLLLQERSYLQLMGSDQPMKGFAPFQSNALTGGLAGTLRVSSARTLRENRPNLVLFLPRDAGHN